MYQYPHEPDGSTVPPRHGHPMAVISFCCLGSAAIALPTFRGRYAIVLSLCINICSPRPQYAVISITMTQYPTEKDPHPQWLNPSQGQGSYTSRDGAPPPPPGGYAPHPQYFPPPGAQGGYPAPSQYPPPQGYYPPPQAHQPQGYFPPPQAPPPQGYYPPPQAPPQAPPPDYGWAQSHPPDQTGYDRKGETYLSPSPSNSPYASAPGADAAGPGPSGSGHGPSPGPQDGGDAMSLGAFFGNKGAPQMWQRQPPPPSAHFPYNPFPPMCLISNTKDLSGGFPEVPPPCQQNPHPFATHDVTEEDWKRFLTDVKKAGSLSGAQRIKSNVIPMVTGMSFFCTSSSRMSAIETDRASS